jgi:tripartite-type tricarboxylate transporter receptor subunit TctC
MMLKRFSGAVLAAATLCFALAAPHAAAQYPTKAITMLVPYAAGGPTDIVARVMGLAMGKPLGQTIIVENRPSNGGILAPEQLTKA